MITDTEWHFHRKQSLIKRPTGVQDSSIALKTERQTTSLWRVEIKCKAKFRGNMKCQTT